jgi:hypothetical protein
MFYSFNTRYKRDFRKLKYEGTCNENNEFESIQIWHFQNIEGGYKKEKIMKYKKQKKNKLRGFSPKSELYRPSDRRLSAKLVPTLADRGCRVVSATNPHGR